MIPNGCHCACSHRFHAHLTKSLAREKNLAQLYTFLAYTQYRARRPFSDPLAKTSQKILRHPEWLIDWQDLDPEQQAAALDELSEHDLRDPSRNAKRLQEILAQRYPLPEELGPQVQFVLEQLLDLIAGQEKQIDQVDQHIQKLIQTGQYPEVAWLDSIRGIGPILSAGLAAEIAGLERFRQVPKWDKRRQVYRPRTPQELEDAIAKIAGLWWPKNSSGAFTAEETPMSKKGNAYLRYYILEAADHMRQWIPRYQAYYRAKFVQATKHKHKRALVLTGRKALGLFVALLRRQEPYRAEEGSSH